MTKLIRPLFLFLTFSLGLAAEANAWTRNGTVTGPRGTASVSAQGSCGDASCQRSISRTGIYGNTVTRSGTASCNSTTGTCSGSRVTTGPHGHSVTRQTTVSR